MRPRHREDVKVLGHHSWAGQAREQLLDSELQTFPAKLLLTAEEKDSCLGSQSGIRRLKKIIVSLLNYVDNL